MAQAKSGVVSLYKARSELAEQLQLPLAGEIERVALAAARGRVLACDLIAPLDLPRATHAAMDGFALRFVDLNLHAPTRLAVVGTARAGHPYRCHLPVGGAVRITTGAPLPAGADTVVPKELCQEEEMQVLVPAGISPGAHVRFAGEELSAGKVAIPAGRRLSAVEIALAAALGYRELPVRRRLRVALCSTGDELYEPGLPLDDKPAAIYDSNRPMLQALLEAHGCEVLDLGILPDNPEALRATLCQASAKADIIITTAGISVGEADFVPAALASCADVAFRTLKLAIKPGKPFTFGIGAGRYFFGLPGNPLAALVAWLTLVEPALTALEEGCPAALTEALPTLPVRLAGSLFHKKGRLTFWPARLKSLDEPVAIPLPFRGSAALATAASADGFLLLDEAREQFEQGTLLPFWPLRARL